MDGILYDGVERGGKEWKAIVFNNSARADTAPDMTLMFHMTSLRIVKGFEEYQHKASGPNSMVNMKETGQHIFASK